MLRNILSFCLVLVAGVSFAQNGTISGTVTDAKTGETVVGANVIIQGTAVGSATDIDGKFTIDNLKPGTYNLSVTFLSYKAHTIPDVIVESGKITTIQVPLQEDVSELKEVVITGTREINTDVSLITAIKESKLVVSGISAEQITKLPDNDAAQVMKRVPGITIVDNRFILIRGIPERYNQVMINSIIGPGTEIDRRSFSFDLIPAGTIDQMLVYKSGTAELPGDFAGGVIKLITKNPSDDNFIGVGLNFGYRAGTTFKDHSYSDGSSTDLLGFDNGYRDLPKNFPSTSVLKNLSRNSPEREQAGKSLTNNFDYNTRTTPVDMGFNFTINRNFNIGSIQAKNFTSVAYSNSYQNYHSVFLRYNGFDSPPIRKRFEYGDDFSGNDVRINLMHNWLFNINDNSKIEFKNLFVQLGEHETTFRAGVDSIQRPSDLFQNYAYHYLSRAIYTGQLEGTHTLQEGSAVLNWVFGTNYITRNEPDYRRFRTFRPSTATDEPFAMLLPPSGNLFETGRFWSDLQDKGFSHALNFEKKFGNLDDKRTTTIKAGYYGEYKTRSFDARYMNYLYPTFSDGAIGEELIRLPLNLVFSPENIKAQDGFVIEEGTTNQDTYEGKNIHAAGYLNASFPLKKFDVSIGFRGEYNVQQLNALFNTGEPVNVDNPVFAALPFFNIAFNIGDRSLIRAAYGRTVNRPEFRELAPFLYYQFEYEAGIFGNPDLETAFIDNIDLRWEMYPNPGEVVSVGVFYKNFRQPIETYLQITTETPQLLFDNAIGATSQGVELEFRKSLASLGAHKFVRNTSINVNAAWIDSRVDIGVLATNQFQNRPLQGQSPYILNAGVYYNDEEAGYSVNAAYNVFGPRIFSVGDKIFPSWWELPRNSLDFQISKRWGVGRLETKLNIQNALNAAYRIYQDNDSDNKIEEGESLIQRYQVGAQFSLGLNWKFNKSNN